MYTYIPYILYIRVYSTCSSTCSVLLLHNMHVVLCNTTRVLCSADMQSHVVSASATTSTACICTYIWYIYLYIPYIGYIRVYMYIYGTWYVCYCYTTCMLCSCNTSCVVCLHNTSCVCMSTCRCTTGHVYVPTYGTCTYIYPI